MACYIYDIYDLYFDLKVVGLPENKSYNSFYQHLNKDYIFEIQKLSINEKESEFLFNNNYFEFKLKLYNLQTVKIHLIYKKSKDLNKLSLAQKEQRKLYRKEEYGFGKIIAHILWTFLLSIYKFPESYLPDIFLVNKSEELFF